jgi:hypothetical protein
LGRYHWDDTASALAWVAGGAGSPANAQTAKTNLAAQRQSLQGLVPLSQGAIVAATTSSGTVEIQSCTVGEHLRCPAGTGSESWTRIVRLEVRDADTFIRLHFSNAESLDVTPHHIFTLADGSPIRAERLCLSDILIGRFGRITLKRIEAIGESSDSATAKKVTVSCEPSHQFFAGHHAATVLTHNYTFSS